MIQKELDRDIEAALRAGDKESLSVLRLLKNSLDASRKNKGELSEEEAIKTLQKEAKQRQDSIKSFREGDRPDLAEKEEKELEIIERYLPKQLSDEELDALVDEAINESGAATQADMGKVMKLLTVKAAGRADNGRMAGVVRSKLS